MELLKTSPTADEVQKAAEEQCRLLHGGECIKWGQAVLLYQHCFAIQEKN